MIFFISFSISENVFPEDRFLISRKKKKKKINTLQFPFNYILGEKVTTDYTIINFKLLLFY